jgi:hypothetical protein
MNARNIAEYLAEFTATSATPTRPCACGDTVFYQLADDAPWRCRSCAPPGHLGWHTVSCRHQPQCDPPEHIRSAIHRWRVVKAAHDQQQEAMAR